MKSYKSILLIITISLIPLLLTATIPWGINTRLELDETEFGDTIGYFPICYYVISLEQGSYYTIRLIDSDEYDYVIRIGDTPYMIPGKRIDTNGNGSTCEITFFQASRTGDHYIQVINKYRAFGSFELRIESGITGTPIGQLEDFISIPYLLVLLLPSSILFLIGLCIFLVKRKSKNNE